MRRCVIGLSISAALFAGCAEATRVEVEVPLRWGIVAGRERVLVVPLGEGPVFDRRAADAVASGIERELLATGRLAVLDRGPAWIRPAADEAEARREALRRGADFLVVLRGLRAEVREGRHHVHEYRDGSAAGEAALLDPRIGSVIRLARERAFASARSRYASAKEVQGIIEDRLALRLSRSLLYGRAGKRVTLADPSDGSLREGIDLARRGEWRAAIEPWERARTGGRHPEMAGRNIAVAREVLGEPAAGAPKVDREEGKP